jgi:hypothetical protein
MTKILSIGVEFVSNMFIKKNEILDFYKKGTWTFTGRSLLEIIIKINKLKYKRYIQRYIKYPGTKNIYNWNLFLQKLS